MNQLLWRIVLTVVVSTALVAGLIAVGAWLREGLRERRTFSVNEIECEAPAGQTREAFLAEVHYYGRLPETLNALDADLPDRLKAAFAKHPRVEHVDKVTITPPKHVRVDLVYFKSD